MKITKLTKVITVVKTEKMNVGFIGDIPVVAVFKRDVNSRKSYASVYAPAGTMGGLEKLKLYLGCVNAEKVNFHTLGVMVEGETDIIGDR